MSRLEDAIRDTIGDYIEDYDFSDIISDITEDVLKDTPSTEDLDNIDGTIQGLETRVAELEDKLERVVEKLIELKGNYINSQDTSNLINILIDVLSEKE